MESELESDKQLFQNSIKYLHSVSIMKSLEAVPALKSFYSTKGRLMELRNAIYLPSIMTRTSVKCQRCLINLLDGPASYTIRAEQKKSKFAKKVLAKFHSEKPLTQFQRKYLKNLDDFNGNHLAITCKFCKKESLIKLKKPKKPVPKIVNDLYQKKKKTKKRDKFCGLNKEAVQALTPQILRNNNNSGSNNRKRISKFKLNNKDRLRRKKVQVTKESIKETAMKLKQKNKKLGKLSQFLNSVDTSKTKSTTKLKHFLQSL